MTKTTIDYCEGCGEHDRPLNADGFCWECIIQAVTGGYADLVGYTDYPLDLDDMIHFLDRHFAEFDPSSDHWDDCLLCQLLELVCDHCGKCVEDIHVDDEDHITLDDYVLIMCPGPNRAAAVLRHVAWLMNESLQRSRLSDRVRV